MIFLILTTQWSFWIPKTSCYKDIRFPLHSAALVLTDTVKAQLCLSSERKSFKQLKPTEHWLEVTRTAVCVGILAECLVSGAFISFMLGKLPMTWHFCSSFTGFSFLPLAFFSAGLKAVSPALTRGIHRVNFSFVLIPHAPLWALAEVAKESKQPLLPPVWFRGISTSSLHIFPNVHLFLWSAVPCCLLLCWRNTFSLIITLFPACFRWFRLAS